LNFIVKKYFEGIFKDLKTGYTSQSIERIIFKNTILKLKGVMSEEK